MGYKSLSYISDKLRANFYVTHSPITPYTSPSPLPQQVPYSPLKIIFQTVITLQACPNLIPFEDKNE